MNKSDIQLSKALSWILRHGAVKEHLNLSPEGYVLVNEVLRHIYFHGKYSLKDIERVVQNNDKQRFKLKKNPISGSLEIKANQGHSIDVSDCELKPILKPSYPTVVHGTYTKFWPQIKEQGLSRMKRNHIHLAKGTPGNAKVISGVRTDAQIYIYIDIEKALHDGIKLKVEDGVNDNGFLEPKYFLKVIHLDSGFPPYTQPQDLIHEFIHYEPLEAEIINNRFAYLTFNTESDVNSILHSTRPFRIYGKFLSVTAYGGSMDSQDSPRREKQHNPQKRDFPRSKQKGVIVEPTKIDLSGDFFQQLERILCTVRLTREEADNIGSLYADVQKVLQAQWPGCVAVPFGSITTGLGIKTSDADCYIHIPNKFQRNGASVVNRAKKILLNYPHIFDEILCIPRANTPIVKFFHIPTGTNCDLSFKTPLGAQNSKLIKFLLRSDPRLVPMAVAIKYWAKVHDLSGTGKLTNYTLTMMIIFYLQQPELAILPSVKYLQRDPLQAYMVDDWNTGFCEQVLPKSSNEWTVRELIGGFFEFYSNFKFEEFVICPYTAEAVKKDLFKDLSTLPNEFDRYKRNILNGVAYPMKYTTAICVQDPLEQSHNVASGITNKKCAEIKAFIDFAAEAYSTEKPECNNLFKTVLLQKPKIIKSKLYPEFRVSLLSKSMTPIMAPDWKTSIRDVVMTVFQKMLKITLEKVEENVNDETGKEKEKYKGVLKKAIWKRKQFARFYNSMKLSFVDKQMKITQEVMKIDKQMYNAEFFVTIKFGSEPKSAVVILKLSDGDLDVFREFGRFFNNAMQGWFSFLLRPYLKYEPRENSANAESGNPKNKKHNEDVAKDAKGEENIENCEEENGEEENDDEENDEEEIDEEEGEESGEESKVCDVNDDLAEQSKDNGTSVQNLIK